MPTPPDPTRPTFAAGAVTGARVDPPTQPAGWPGLPASEVPDVISSGRPPGSRRPSRRALLTYGGVAGGVLVLGLIVLLVLILNGQWGSGSGLLSGHEPAPPDLRPPLAKLCPAPSAPAPLGDRDAPPPTGARTVDEQAGISYAAYGPPWVPWPSVWAGGTLAVPYGVGQHFVTESFSGGIYHASILSAAVPATVNDSTAIDIQCVGQQVAADVRAEYYPQPNTMDLMREGMTTIDGRPAWVTKFRLHFDEPGLKAKSELVSVALIDVGKPTAAVLYVSIPDTHPQWDHVVDEVIASARAL